MNETHALDRYRGDGRAPEGGALFPYRADPALVRAVNLAIVLERPLLIQGEPGVGKTRLARSIAHELGLPLHEWHVKSTSRAIDGLYSIDTLRRLQDVQLQREKAQTLAPYLRFGPLGEALRSDGESVVLIDEIDKADIDFPNDLLRELEEKRFTIEELDPAEAGGLQRTYEAKRSPVVVVTSNDEKELPDAFLRRCVYYFIPFPTRGELIEIVIVNLPKARLDRELVSRAAGHLLRLQAEQGRWRKVPATSELIDWVEILHRRGVKVEELDETRQLASLPDWPLLFKRREDLRLLQSEAHET